MRKPSCPRSAKDLPEAADRVAPEVPVDLAQKAARAAPVPMVDGPPVDPEALAGLVDQAVREARAVDREASSPPSP